MLGILLLVGGLALLAFHRSLSSQLHQAEGPRRDVLGGEARARFMVLLAGAAFTLCGVLVVTGVFAG